MNALHISGQEMDINEFNGMIIDKVLNSLGQRQNELHFLHGTKVE
jgi:hypothetical protein